MQGDVYMALPQAWRRILGRSTGRRQGGHGNAKAARPRLEALEDRVVPANWFVSTLGVDDLAHGSPGAPFRSIQFAINVAQSGDRIHVAQGTYGYNPGADQLSGFLHVNPAVLMIYDKSLQIFGGFDNSFTTWAPATNHTVIDGGSALRGVYVLGNQVDVSLDLEGFTVEACLGKAERNLDPNAGNDRIFGFGGGMWINDTARNGSGTPGAFVLRDMIFFGNRAAGFDTTQLGAPEPGQTPGVGGAGAGAAIALRYVANITLDRVTFNNNEADGGAGSVRGGDAVGGAIHSDHSHITGTNLVFVNNRSLAGSSSGNGVSTDPGGISGGLQRRTADGLAGAAAIQIESSAALQNVVAYGNGAVGGNSGSGVAGSGEAGAFLIEDSDVTMTDVVIRNNLARGGNGGLDGGLSGGGGLATDGVNLTLNRVQVVGNVSQSGGGSRNAGSPGGGGIYLVAIKPGDRNSVQVLNSVIANNVVQFGGGGQQYSVGGGGAGAWLQGVNATFTHVTFDNNQLGQNVFFGQALLLLNDGLNNGPAPTLTTATVNYSIIADHTNGNNPTANTVHLRPQNGRNVLTYNQVLFANNTNDDNSGGRLEVPPPGAYNGLNTVQQAATAGFVSPGAPRFDYDLLPTSPAVDAAFGSSMTTDIEQRLRFGVPDLGAYEAPADVPARGAAASYDPGSGLWQIRDSNAGGPANVAIFAFGLGAGLSIPVVGDWTGSGHSGIGVVEVVPDPNNPGGPNVLMWKLRNTDTPGAPDIPAFVYGQQGDIPVVGDWNGDGTTTIGIYEPDTGTWKLRNTNAPGAPDYLFAYGGAPGTVPVTGDWDGNGTTTIGVVEKSGGVLVWKLRNENSGGGPDAGVFPFGAAGYKPVTGDWNSDGVTTAGVVDPVTSHWYLRNENSPGGPDAGSFVFSEGSATPLAGNWDGLSPERAAGGAVSNSAVPALTDAQLRAFASAALGGAVLPKLQVADLPGDLLGLADPATGRILIDANGAGYGWFVDPTPGANEEFDAALHALAGGPADGRMDLRTVLLHELGHLSGQPDQDGTGGLMDGALPAGVRRE
jgi:hypothetical protein